MMSGELVTTELYNALGARVKNIELYQISGKTTIRIDNPGFYTLRVNMKKEVKIFKLLGN